MLSKLLWTLLGASMDSNYIQKAYKIPFNAFQGPSHSIGDVISTNRSSKWLLSALLGALLGEFMGLNCV